MQKPVMSILELLGTPEFKAFSQKHLGRKLTIAKAGEWIRFRRWEKKWPMPKEIIVKQEVISYNSKKRTRIIKRTVWARLETLDAFKKTWRTKNAPRWWGSRAQIPYKTKEGLVWGKIQNNWIFNVVPKESDVKYFDKWLRYKVPKECVALFYESNDGHNNFVLLPNSLSLDDFFWEGLGLQQGDGSQELKSCHVTFTNSCLPLIVHQLQWFMRFGISKEVVRIYPEIPKTANEKEELQKIKRELSKIEISESQFRRTKGGKTTNARNTIVQLVFHNKLYKLFYTFLLHYFRTAILNNENYAKAYIRGIIAAEGCVRVENQYNGIIHSVKISVSSEGRRAFYRKCLQSIGIVPSKDELTKGSEAVIITKFDNFVRLYEINALELHPQKQKKFTEAFKNYERAEQYLTEEII